jgi:AcrR family transcriptional regulator
VKQGEEVELVKDRPALTRERILEAAVAVADRGGLSAVSMRNVGREAGVEAMSLYHHVRSKGDLLDALADWIFAEVIVPGRHDPWREAMEVRAGSLRSVLTAHPWSLTLVEARRSPGPTILADHEAVLACLRTSGLSVPLAAHAFAAIDSYVYGFALTEQNLPIEKGERTDEFVEEIGVPLEQYPFLAEYLAVMVVGKDFAFADEFGYGLALILDQLELQHARETGAH